MTVEGMVGLKMVLNGGAMFIGGQPVADGMPNYFIQVHRDGDPNADAGWRRTTTRTCAGGSALVWTPTMSFGWVNGS